MNLANCSYVAKINPNKILPLNTEFIAPVIIISCKHGRLVEYFCREPKQKLSVLPDPKGSLYEKVPSSSTELTNNIAYDILDRKTTPRGKHGEYISLTSTKFANFPPLI